MEADALGGGDGGLELGAVGPVLLEELLDVGHATGGLLAPSAGASALPLTARPRPAAIGAGVSSRPKLCWFAAKRAKLHEFPVAEWLLLRAVVCNFADDEFPAPSVFRGVESPCETNFSEFDVYPFGSPFRCIVRFRSEERHIFSGTHSSSPAPKSTKTFDFWTWRK